MDTSDILIILICGIAILIVILFLVMLFIFCNEGKIKKCNKKGGWRRDESKVYQDPESENVDINNQIKL